jgi:hypothetical protein
VQRRHDHDESKRQTHFAGIAANLRDPGSRAGFSAYEVRVVSGRESVAVVHLARLS